MSGCEVSSCDGGFGFGGGFAFIVVLFILLIIVGASFVVVDTVVDTAGCGYAPVQGYGGYC